MNLNESQKKAIEITEGPLLVLAGAGTGKTRVLTSRIIHIVNSYLASAHNILAVTFTNKAAAEMKKRIAENIGDQVNNLWMGTFHSIAAKILRRHPEIVSLKSDFTIIDDDDQTRLIKRILEDLNIDNKQFPAKSYLNKISRFKDKIIFSIDEARTEDLALPALNQVYKIYQERLRSMNAVDFGDLLLYNLEIFAKSPEILSYYQDKFRYILVDEYQDTNNAQYRWLIYLAKNHQNICCVGDDDQSIYSWRGANVANILQFEKDFKNAKIVRLEQNYRSTSRILKAADLIISNNKERHKKTLFTNQGQGDKVKLISFIDDRVEANSVAQMIKTAINKQKYRQSEIAVLVRAGYQTRTFEESFIHQNISYKVIGGMKFYQRSEIRDAMAYLRVCTNFSDDLALNRIINVPKRGIGEAAISKIYQKAKIENVSFFESIKKSIQSDELKGKAKNSAKEFIEKISYYNSSINQTNLSELARSILTDLGYIEMHQAENSIESQSRIENIEEFINSLSEFSNITEFLEYVSLVESKDEKNTDSVSIMTIHAAKGLEFDLVFIPGLEEGIFPSAKSIEIDKALEEERRLAYVAITRAKKELIISYANNRYMFGSSQSQIPSCFVKELLNSDLEIYQVDGFGNLVEKNHQSLLQDKIDFRDNFFINSDYQKYPEKNYSTNSNKFQKNPDFPSEEKNNLAGKRVFHTKFGYGKVINQDGDKLNINFEKTSAKVIMKDFVKVV
jgi:DNA helicase-2/ATP-dependent DNA helicase PcrA